MPCQILNVVLKYVLLKINFDIYITRIQTSSRVALSDLDFRIHFSIDCSRAFLQDLYCWLIDWLTDWFRYRKFSLGDGINLVVRCEIDAVLATPNNEMNYLSIKALNEFDPRVSLHELFVICFCKHLCFTNYSIARSYQDRK